jgi:hypothetical protein
MVSATTKTVNPSDCVVLPVPVRTPLPLPDASNPTDDYVAPDAAGRRVKRLLRAAARRLFPATDTTNISTDGIHDV